MHHFAGVLPLLLAARAVHAMQPGAVPPRAAPLRRLQWGQLNFLHTTDTHGWHAGHLQEASFSADWGDYISFAHHLSQEADSRGVDLLVIDTGDRVEGNGLYDGSEPKGKYTFDILKHQHIDILCAGNHELYKANSSNNELQQSVPNFKGNYLASNLDILNPQTGDIQPLAPRYKKFVTKNQGIRVTAFGFIFNFGGNANNTVVKRVQDTIKEQWFVDAIQDKEVDLFLVAGHVPVRNSEEFDAIFAAIRSEHWDTPIQFFGGHTHVRDYKKYDRAAVALESGRYMETIGWQSIEGLRTGGKNNSLSPTASVTFQRRYIDNNLYSLRFHSNQTEDSFDIELGKNVTRQITAARTDLKLDTRRGCAPQDYWMTRVPANDSSSIFRLLGEDILPSEMKPSHGHSNLPKIVLTNTGAIRFDLFKGPFTRDSEYLISPFTSGFRYVHSVDWKAARQLVQVLNQGGQIFQTLSGSLPPPQPLREHGEGARSNGKLYSSFDQVPIRADVETFPGYITYDDDGDEGDDTVHEMIDQYRVPNAIQSMIGFPEESEPEKVDVVYNEFIEPWILIALKSLGQNFARGDTAYYDERSMTMILADWVQKNWPC